MTRDEMILSVTATVRSLTKIYMLRAGRALSDGARSEIFSAAWLGAVEAVDRFEPGHGCILKSFAEYRIRGAILDYLRREDPVGRYERAIYPHRAASTSTTSLDYISVAPAEAMAPIGPRLGALEASLDVEKLFSRAQLSPRTRNVVERIYLREETARSVATVWGIHESRVSQIRAAGIRALRAAAESRPLPVAA